MSKNKYQSFNHFILRSPLFPIKFLRQILSEENTSNCLLKDICQRNDIQEAIFLASPNLHTKINKWLNGEITDKKEINNLPQTIYKYLARMSSRCTPFGLFAGNAIGQINDQTNLIIPDHNSYRRVTRLDMNYLCSLVQDLANRYDVRELSTFFPNNSIYVFGDELRYVEYYYRNTRRIHHIASVNHSEYLKVVLGKAKLGVSISELTEVLIDEEISKEEANVFVHELIDNQLLLAEFEPTVTGSDFLGNIMSFLKDKEFKDNPYELLQSVSKQLKQLDSHPTGMDVSKYHEIAKQIGLLGINYELKFLFQTDMIKPTKDLSISMEIANRVKEGIEVLNKFSKRRTETNLTKFRDAFYKKYEDAEVPLLQALDTESGIGYLQNYSVGSGDYSPLVDDLALPQITSQSMHIEWSNFNAFLFNKYISAVKENQYKIEIEEKEIKELFNINNLNKLPVTISSIVQLVNLEGQDIIIMTSAGGSNAANLTGRFCHTDKKILDHVHEIVQKDVEFDSDKIIAEIVHLPESRVGNILHRPILYKFELPYLAKSPVSKEFQVLPEDLFISVKNNRVILRSKRLNKEIIPRLTTAHNFTYNSLPVYHFLCDMQTQGLNRGVGFDWGPLASQYSFLPRVCYKNLIFSLASWNIRKRDFEKIAIINDDTVLLKEVKKWQEYLNIPEWVVLEDGDNELVIKLSNLLSVKTLISMVKKRPNFVLKEFLGQDENMMVRNEEGSFTNEVVLSFYREQ